MLDSPNEYINLSSKTVDDFVEEESIKKFFLEDIDDILSKYELGDPIHKPDVKKNLDHLIQLRKERQQNSNMQVLEKKLYDQTILIQSVVTENNMLKEKIAYLEDKMKQIIRQAIETKKTK